MQNFYSLGWKKGESNNTCNATKPLLLAPGEPTPDGNAFEFLNNKKCHRKSAGVRLIDALG